jgi:LacI family transcriptional regulator
MATIKDVAREAGVGLGTASRALNETGSVSPESRKRVLAAAKKLKFVPNQMARNMRKQSTGCVALIIPTIFHTFFSKFAFYCEAELFKLGYRMIVVSSQDDKHKEEAMLDMIKQQRVDGVIFSTHYAHEDIDPALPIVTIDGHLGNAFSCVTSNNYQASYDVIRRLYDRGARRIGCICGTTEAFSETSFRYRAYSDCVRDLNLPERLYKTNFKHGQETEVVAGFLAAYPDADAIFTSSDTLAIVAYNRLKDAGKRVPQDVQIVGFDGILDSVYTNLQLTTVRQDIEKMAKIAVEVVIQKIGGQKTPERIEVETTFVVGDTTL